MLKVIGETKQAAVRELQEELGITVESLTLQLEEVVDENGGDHVKVNIPMALVQVALDMGMELPQVSGNSALKNLDLAQIVNMVRQGAIGNLLEVETDDEVVRIFVE